MEKEKRLIVDALKKYHDAKFTPGVYEHSIFGKAAMLLETDAVEVVRCRDCKHSSGTRTTPNTAVCFKRCEIVPAEHFCSHGESREGE